MLGCHVTEYIKYPRLNDEIYSNNNLKELFRSNKNPAIVLRVPNTSDKATSQTTNTKDNTLLYNAVEKEFLKAGFSVRDRGLFNEIISRQATTDYSKIKDLTETDIIIEVVNIETTVLYTTNQTIRKSRNGEDKEIIKPTSYIGYGASVEFKIVIIKNNEVAGTYKYNYNPCPEEGCILSDFSRKDKRSKDFELIETVSANSLEEFMKKCAQDLIKTFRQN